MQFSQITSFNRRKLANRSVQARTTIDDVCPGIMADIISRLPVESIIACKLVCTNWYYVTKDPLFIKIHLSRTSNRLLLLPVFGKEANFPRQYIPLVDTDNRTIKPIPNFKIPFQGYYQIKCSHNGLLCVASENGKADPLALVNPILGEHVTLPKAEGTDRCQLTHYVVSLGCNSSGQYKIVRYYRYRRRTRDCKLEILSLGNGQWREIDLPLSHLEIMHAVFYGGIFFFVFTNPEPIWSVDIIAIDLKTEKIQRILYPYVFSQHPGRYLEMVELGGILGVVGRDSSYLRVWRVCGEKVGELWLQSRYLFNTKIEWGHMYYFRTIGRVDRDTYLLWHNVHKDYDRNVFALFKPLEKPGWLEYPIAGLPYTFSPMWFKPSFIRPLSALLGPPFICCPRMLLI